MEMGRRIARYRKLNGLTAAELANRAGADLTREIVAKIETGNRPNISFRQVLAIAWELGVPPVALIADIEKPFRPSEFKLPDGTVLSVQEVMQWFAGRGLPDEAPVTPAGAVVAEIARELRSIEAIEGVLARSLVQGLDESGDLASPEALESVARWEAGQQLVDEMRRRLSDG